MDGAGVRLALIAAGALSVMLTACSPMSAPEAPDLMKLRVGVALTPAPALPESVLWLARDLGFYQKEGLDVEIVEASGTPQVITAMRAGGVDIGDINSEDVIRLTASGDLPMRTINSSNGRNFFMIVARNNIGSVEELKGKSYAVAQVGSQDYALSSKVLSSRGVPPDSLNYVAVGAPNARAQALVAGQIDATTVSLATWVTIQSQPNIHVLMNADDYYNALPLVNQGDAVTTQVLQQKPEALRRFTAAIIKTSRYLAENKSAWVDGMAHLRPEMARSDLEYLWDQFGSSWAVNGQINMAAYQASTDFLYAQGTLEDAPKIGANDWVDPEFVDSVLKDLGVYPGVDDPGRPIA
jgi:NitT/TauT family transport system substrate-binding protein